jgi:hypothetical protein
VAPWPIEPTTQAIAGDSISASQALRNASRPSSGGAFDVKDTEAVDRLHAEVLRAGDDPRAMSRLLEEWQPSDHVLMALLRRAVPRALLEVVARTEPWSRRGPVLAAIVTSPRADKALSLRLLSFLTWRPLATVTAMPWVSGAVRVRAEALLVEGLPDLKLGERVALARIATRPITARLISDPEAMVVEAALLNPRLAPDDLLAAIRRDTAPRVLLESAASSARWAEVYSIRLALVLQPRTPLAVALGQLSALVDRDLERVEHTPGLRPLLQVAAGRLRERRRAPKGTGGATPEN